MANTKPGGDGRGEVRAFIQERHGCTCWYCSGRREARASLVLKAEPEWRPADRSAS
jgi:hypothetical protein